jgi:hypothetical protein
VLDPNLARLMKQMTGPSCSRCDESYSRPALFIVGVTSSLPGAVDLGERVEGEPAEPVGEVTGEPFKALAGGAE